MTEDFCFVTRKKWIARKCLQRSYELISRGDFDNCPDVDVEKFMSRLNKICIRMARTDYFKQSMCNLEQSILELHTKSIPKRIVCFGIGPFTRAWPALHQLAFILETQKYYNIRDVKFYDPIFSASEKLVLDTLKCTLMRQNCEAKYAADVLTIFYMPHCPNYLTNNLLWCNWKPELLQNVVLINNSFKSLSTSKPERLLRVDAEYMLRILPYVTEVILKDIYPSTNVFNDLSTHVFPANILPSKTGEIWIAREMPSYEDTKIH